MSRANRRRRDFAKIKQRSAFSVAAIALLALTFSAAIGACSSKKNAVTLSFQATVAKGVPQGTKVSIGSELNEWDPRDSAWYATQLDETHFSLDITLGGEWIGREIAYKWTLQYPESTGNGWEYYENVSAAAADASGNRTYRIKRGANQINDAVTFPDRREESKGTVTCGTLEVIEMDMPQFSDGRKRKIRVWLPDGYDEADRSKRYSVLYMHDGQNLFDAATSFLGEWKVDESLTRQMKAGYESTIVVGIDNGESERFNELSPSWALSDLGKEYISAPAGEKYAEFIVSTVKPYIDAHYNTDPRREKTGVGGSSMGGIISLFMAIKYAHVFDYGIIFSPALHVYEQDALDRFFERYSFTVPQLPKLYLFAGEKRGGSQAASPYDESCISQYVGSVKENLMGRNYPGQLIGTCTDPNGYHNENTWAKAFPSALQWLSEVRGNGG